MTVKTTTYSAKELDQIFNNSPDVDVEGGQAHQVFLELKRRVENGLTISFTESLYFYYGVKYATGNRYGKTEDYEVCQKHTFSYLYLIYAPDNLGCQLISLDEKRNIISLEQRRADNARLTTFLNEWEKQIDEKPMESLMKRIKLDTENDLKKVDKLSIGYGSKYVDSQKRKVLLRSRYTYNTVSSILDWSGEEIEISGSTLMILFKPESLFHILYRHYGRIGKPQLIVNEDYFGEKIDFKQLGNILKVILETIYSTGLISHKKSDTLNIKYKGTVYLIVIRNSTIITFYPVSKPQRLKNLATNYNLHKIDNSLSVYIKK